MKISRLISAILLVLGLIIIGRFGFELASSSKQYREVEQLGALAEARTAWIDGTLALSLERSVSQVALSIEDPAPQAFLDLINQQRDASDLQFGSLGSVASEFPKLKTAAVFIKNVASSRANITKLRTEIDALLQIPKSDRSAARSHEVPFELKTEIAKLKAYSEYLKIENRMTSSTAMVLMGIQNRAWEVREFGGRARTYYAIATLNQASIGAEDTVRVQLDTKRAQNAWNTLLNMSESIDLPADIRTEIDSADTLYFDKYLKTLDQLDAAMVVPDGQTFNGLPISFNDFFKSSNAALDDVASLSKQAGTALISYWGGRQKVEFFSVFVNLAAVLFVLLLVPALMIFVRKRITSRLETTALAVEAVSNGDLNQSLDQRDNDLVEIAALTNSIRDLKATLSDANNSRQLQEANQIAQQEAVDALTHGLRRIAAGELNCAISDPFGENYEALRIDFNATCHKLNELVSALVLNSSGISREAVAVNTASADLSRRTESQASALAQTAASIQQLTETVKLTAQSADDADMNTVKAKQSASGSHKLAQESAAAMEAIEESSAKISSIMELIDDTAFQTNLLALNAGVEAARAGEAGAGFAVVANEVRNLAHRATQAAKEIKQLINDSSNHVKNGVELAVSTGSSLSEIIEMVENVSTLVSEISSASQQQATSLAEINTTATELDRVTQQNAAMAEEVTAVSQSLQNEATQLDSLSGQFVLENKIRSQNQTTRIAAE
jgi:methyl-accepting chemotaxis protein